MEPLDLEKSIFNKKVLIIGDVMLDSYLFGSVDRISPEAPVPVVLLKHRDNRLGGAANVAINIQSLGAYPILCSVIGNDIRGKEFVEKMQFHNLPSFGIIQSSNRITTTKFRIIGNNSQLIRVDEEIETPLDKEDFVNLYDKIEHILENDIIDIVIFEDYDKGVICGELIEKIIFKTKILDIPVVVDPKKKNFNNYNRSTIFKPNLKELREGTKTDIDYSDIKQVENLVENYITHNEIKIALITLSEKGVLVVWRDDENNVHKQRIEAHYRTISDVSGAGDSVISVAALCYVAGLEPTKIAQISNLAGGLVCEEVGVVSINKDKLFNEIRRLKIL